MKLNFMFFVRILLRHVWLLILLPLLLGIMVFALTHYQPKVFNSKTRIYTGFASGSSIELDNKVDYGKTSIAYDNFLNLIKSRTTLETVSLKLLAQHLLLDSVNNKVIFTQKRQELMKMVPKEVIALTVEGDAQKTYENLLAYKEGSNKNFINELLSLDHPDYSIEKISDKIKVWRVGMSDYVDISYQSEDPGICHNTLLILTETFVDANAIIKANQSDAVVSYFEDQLQQTTEQLNQAEQELLNFNKGNKIMNYEEQTKQLALRKENFESRYQEAQQRYHAARAVLPELEKRLGTHEKKRLQSKRILELRNQLSELNYAISMNSLDLSRDSIAQVANEDKIKESTKKLEAVKKELKQAVDTVFVVDYDKEGLASSNILTDWLENTITYEGAKAELDILDQKRIEFDELYTMYAPLGATMKKLERKINIEEQEYLSLLHSLGLAKLKQQNVEMQSNLKVTEEPFFPIKPNPGKKLRLVIVAMAFGFVLVAFTILMLEFFDGNLKTAKRAEEKIGLKVSSIFPAINAKRKRKKDGFLLEEAVNAMSKTMILNRFKKDSEGPVANVLFSTQENEGKTFVGKHLAQKLCELGHKVLHISNDGLHLDVANKNYKKVTYGVNDHLYNIAAFKEFDQSSRKVDTNTFDFIILELPPIMQNPFPVELFSKTDHSFLVVRANRAWEEADSNALKLFNNSTNGPEPTIILNGVKDMEMETVVGKLPKKRSKLVKQKGKVTESVDFPIKDAI